MPTASLINAWADNVIMTSPIIHYQALHSMFSISLLRYVQLSRVAQGILQAKIENFRFFPNPQKPHDHTVKGGQYTAQDTVQTIF